MKKKLIIKHHYNSFTEALTDASPTFTCISSHLYVPNNLTFQIEVDHTLEMVIRPLEATISQNDLQKLLVNAVR